MERHRQKNRPKTPNILFCIILLTLIFFIHVVDEHRIQNFAKYRELQSISFIDTLTLSYKNALQKTLESRVPQIRKPVSGTVKIKQYNTGTECVKCTPLSNIHTPTLNSLIAQQLLTFYGESPLQKYAPSVSMAEGIYGLDSNGSRIENVNTVIAGRYITLLNTILISNSSPYSGVLHEFAHAIAGSTHATPLEPLLANICGYYAHSGSLPQSYSEIESYQKWYKLSQKNIPEKQQVGDLYFLTNSFELFANAIEGTEMTGQPYIIPSDIIAQLLSQYSQNQNFNTHSFAQFIDIIRGRKHIRQGTKEYDTLFEALKNFKVQKNKPTFSSIPPDYLETIYQDMMHKIKIQHFLYMYDFFEPLLMTILIIYIFYQIICAISTIFTMR